MSRGNERRPIVRDDVDRLRRLEWLQRTVEIHGWRLHAFVLMTNHEHLFLATPQPNLSAGMQLLNGSYSSYFNHRHRRVGHLFQGRFKALLVEEAGYSLELSRYLHLNPFRAGIVTKPEQYPWSSYPGYHWRSRMRTWVTYEAVLREFGHGEAEARAAYRRFLCAGMAEPPAAPWKDAPSQLLLVGVFLFALPGFGLVIITYFLSKRNAPRETSILLIAHGIMMPLGMFYASTLTSNINETYRSFELLIIPQIFLIVGMAPIAFGIHIAKLKPVKQRYG